MTRRVVRALLGAAALGATLAPAHAALAGVASGPGSDVAMPFDAIDGGRSSRTRRTVTVRA